MEMFYLKKVLPGRLLTQNYVTSKTIQKILFYLSNRFKLNETYPPLLIYQMGKVGSLSIYHSIKQCRLKSPVYHLHVLSEDGVKALDCVIRDSFTKTRYVPEHLITSEFFRPYLCVRHPKIRCKVITLVRDPIARNISSFFGDLNTRHFYLDPLTMLNSDDVEDATGVLINAFIKNHDHLKPLNWFDMELNKVLRMDIYSKPFDKEKGFEIYENDSCSALVIKLERLNQCAKQAFSQFLLLSDFQLISKNISNDKNYGKLYRTVSQSIKIPNDYIDVMYNSKLVQHVYTENEIIQFKNKWLSTH